jgi:hypothetical protein
MPTNTIKYLFKFMYSIRMVVYCTLGNGTCDGKAVTVPQGFKRDSLETHSHCTGGVV